MGTDIYGFISHPLGFCFASIFGILLYVTIISLYRITLHPLAKYPGPFLSKISNWSIVIQARSGDRHIESWKEHERYGPIVRIAPNTLSINTTSALKEIYGSRKAKVQKAQWYRTLDADSGAFSTHSEIDKTKHAFLRRVLDHAFSESALKSAEEFILDSVRIWCKYLGSEEGQSVKFGEWTPAKNMTNWANYLAYDIMGDLTYGKRFECIEKDEHRYVPKLMMNGTEFVYVVSDSDLLTEDAFFAKARITHQLSTARLPPLRRPRPSLMGTAIMEFISGSMARDSATYIRYANAQIDSRITDYKASTASNTNQSTDEKSIRKDFTHYLLRARDPVTSLGLTTAELHADSALLIAAGADTTSITITACFFHLLHNPGTLATLLCEIHSTFPTIEDIHSGPTLVLCVYLRACIDETLRLAPPVPSHLPREVVPGGLQIDDHFFPAGKIVGTATWAIHHHTAYFPDPFLFRPERWLPATSEARAAFCPYNLGPRGCVGRVVAYAEVSLAIAYVLWQYDICFGEGGPTGGGGGGGTSPDGRSLGPERWRRDEYQLYDRFTAHRDGPMVKFRARLGGDER